MNVDLVRLVLRDVLVKLRENSGRRAGLPKSVSIALDEELREVIADLEVGEVSIIDYIRGRLEERARGLDPENLMDSAAELRRIAAERHKFDRVKKNRTGFAADHAYPAVFVDEPSELIIQGPRGPWPPNWLLPTSVCEIIDRMRETYGEGQHYVICRVEGDEPVHTHYRVYPIHPRDYETNETSGSHATGVKMIDTHPAVLAEEAELRNDRKRETVGDLADRIYKASVERFRDNTPGEVTCEDLESRIESMLAVLAKEVAAIIVKEREA